MEEWLIKRRDRTVMLRAAKQLGGERPFAAAQGDTRGYFGKEMKRFGAGSN